MEQEAIPAATLIVVRDLAEAPPNLLIVERAAGMAFAGGALVFPGGRIDIGDDALAGGSSEIAAKIAAIRETLEETGVVVGLDPLPAPDIAWKLQDALIAGAPFDDLIAAHGLALNLDALTPFARWKPAFLHARRFDTSFFVARAPAGDWLPRPQAGECEDAMWMSAADVLARIGRGEASAIFPTLRNLERLAALPQFDAIVADAQAHPIETITPWIEERDGVPHIIIPDNLGYPVTSEPLSDTMRG
jgi:8-oxo-dGTP pyrophosphatase MutT (NUDIX family)